MGVSVRVSCKTFLQVVDNPNNFSSSHGYRGIDARRNLWVLPSGELLYYVAAVAVLLDRDEDAQRHYTGHTEDIMW